MSAKKKSKKKKGLPLSEQFTNWVWSKSSLGVHTIFFVGSFLLVLFGINLEQVLLVLTTVVSLEAIYLAIFIQMTVNRNTASLKSVEKDIDEIQEDIDEIQEDVDEIQENVDEIQEDDEEDELESDKTIQYIEKIESQMQIIVKEISELKNLKK
ncbi:MAG: hypothetical protein ACD_78C00057G0004 [uncultured bacterium (gcode 4)]|uniref:DUF1003 domain-containing protein n=1 Tax=uncultured bacterium (gcode 4) TaxID=1234023 RepID=K1XZ59_9BACT|nr:MAG: hypothetical protein ACD_78C00057G0004 [uncultured bacterium (gcode 4)]